MLIFDRVTKSFGPITAVDGVSLSVARGEMVAVIGRSGAGKSTLLRLVNRLAEPTSGDIAWNGASVARLKGAPLRSWRRRCAMVFQQFQLAPRLDVLTNVMVGDLAAQAGPGAFFKMFPAAVRARAVLELDALGMAGAALQRAQTLSGGQQQRVAIARAMMQAPEIVLADEPIASLDPINAALVMEALRRINQERGITVIVNLHAMDIARRFCDRVIGMAAGKVVFDGPCAALTPAAQEQVFGAAPAEEGASPSPAPVPEAAYA